MTLPFGLLGEVLVAKERATETLGKDGFPDTFSWSGYLATSTSFGREVARVHAETSPSNSAISFALKSKFMFVSIGVSDDRVDVDAKKPL